MKIKGTEIHNGLDKKEIRDFLSGLLNEIRCMEKTNEKVIIPYVDPAIEWSIKNTEEDVKFHQRRLQYIKDKAAVLQIIQILNWKEFDVSDYTYVSDQYWLSFIGTKEERDQFISLIKK